jgi:hypothetical protein
MKISSFAVLGMTFFRRTICWRTVPTDEHAALTRGQSIFGLARATTRHSAARIG